MMNYEHALRVRRTRSKQKHARTSTHTIILLFILCIFPWNFRNSAENCFTVSIYYNKLCVYLSCYWYHTDAAAADIYICHCYCINAECFSLCGVLFFHHHHHHHLSFLLCFLFILFVFISFFVCVCVCIKAHLQSVFTTCTAILLER